MLLLSLRSSRAAAVARAAARGFSSSCPPLSSSSAAATGTEAAGVRYLLGSAESDLSLHTEDAAEGEPATPGGGSGVFTVTFNRMQGRNSFSKAFLGAFEEAIEMLRFEKDARCALLRSTVPRVFCAGADLKERATMPLEEVAPFVARLRGAMSAWEDLPMPTVAVIEGAALGGGLELAMCCDLRVAGGGALLGLPETALAIIPGAGGTQRLPRLVGMPRAKDLVFRARRINATEAERIGLVNVATEAGQAEEEARVMARDIATNGPIAIRAAKTALNQGAQVDLQTSLRVEQLCYAQVIHTADRVEGLTAFKEKRKPEYRGE